MTTQTHDSYVPEWTFADRVRKIRRDAGLSQADFAARINVGDKRYSAWETGRNQPGGEIVAVSKRIELAFGVPAAWVLGLEMTTAPGPRNGPEGGGKLPRLDSNQQPSGYPFAQVTALRPHVAA